MDTAAFMVPGTILMDRYEIIRQIGAGGMSNVYLVRDLRLNMLWTLKEVRTQDRDFYRQVIMEEMNLLARLSHPCLPRIVDIIDDEQTFGIVMDYIEGRTLGDILMSEGPQSVEKVIHWAIQLCDVLQYLHTRKPPVIYRDMKPDNVMLKQDGNVVLVDFGTAREYKTEDLGDTTILGTVGYAAPEQFGGNGQTDQRTDIYGLGATMYYLIIGRRPTETAFNFPPLFDCRPELKEDAKGMALEKIIARCCASEREKRFQSCSELGLALRQLTQFNETNSSSAPVAERVSRILADISRNIFSLKTRSGIYKKEEVSRKYQVFISFKHTDGYGNETPDSRLAEGLYKKLRAKNIKVYYSKKSIEVEGSDKYKNSISHALMESRILVVVGTRPDYMSAPWVRREYQEFRSKMKHAGSADAFAIFNYLGPEMHVNSLPEELADYTSYTDPEKLKDVIVSRLFGSGRQEEMPEEMRADAVWEHYRSGVIIKKRYQLYKCVKEGNYYKLFEAADLNVNNNPRLVKIVNKYLLGDASDPEIECLKLLSDISGGIPTIYDYGDEEEITYLVTDYPHGTRLDELMKNSAINEDEVIAWMLDLCETLRRLHSHTPGVIHCNIKPSNIYIENEKTELINFSAAFIDGQSPRDGKIVSGKRYRAPEFTYLLASRTRPGPSADIYSLGLTMQEALLRGKNALRGRNKKPKISRGLQYVLQKCTCIDPSARYQTVSELENDLTNTTIAGLKAMKESLQRGINLYRRKRKAPPESPVKPPEIPTPHCRNSSSYEWDSSDQTVLLRPSDYESR